MVAGLCRVDLEVTGRPGVAVWAMLRQAESKPELVNFGAKYGIIAL